MSTYLYAYPSRLELDPFIGDLVYDREHDGQHIYLSGSELGYPEGTLIGVWGRDGAPQGPIDPLFFELRPFGNSIQPGREGEATDRLDYHYWAGDPQRQVQAEPAPDTNPHYPEDNQPIILTMEREWDTTSGWEGWGWRATIEFSDPNRPPSSRAIGIYTEDWAYLYTTGAFVWTDTGEVDGEGQSVFKWQTHNPPGKATAERESLNYALLLGSVQEGKMELWPLEDSKTNFFWEADQTIPGGSSWVDSGETVTGMAGTVVLVSDVAPFPTGTQVRIEGDEALVTSIWAGQGLELDPYVPRTSGASIEIWS